MMKIIVKCICVTYTHLPATVANRCVASLWHVVGVLSAAGRQLPRANGRGRSRRRARVQIQHGLLGKTLPFWTWAVFHLHGEVKEERKPGEWFVRKKKKQKRTKKGEKELKRKSNDIQIVVKPGNGRGNK